MSGMLSHGNNDPSEMPAITAVLCAMSLMCGCGQAVPGANSRNAEIKLTEDRLPFTHQVTLAKGEAVQFELPNGKGVAFWCDSAHPLLEDRQLSLLWGERPFQLPRVRQKKVPGRGKITVGWDSYIRSGAVLTSTRTNERIRELFVDNYRIEFRESRVVDGKLRVTLRVRLATKRETLVGEARLQYYRRQVQSDRADDRLEAIEELSDIANSDTAPPAVVKEIVAIARRLRKDPSEDIRSAAESSLCRLGDEETLLGLISPQPKEGLRSVQGGRRFARWTRRDKSAEKIVKQILTFFDSTDENLVGFALGFFSCHDEDPAAKEHILAALRHESPVVRAEATDLLRFYCERADAVERLVGLLEDPHTDVVSSALQGLSFLSDVPPTAVTPFIRHNDSGIRTDAAMVLRKQSIRQSMVLSGQPDPTLEEPLLVLTTDGVPQVRVVAADALGCFKTRKAHERLVEMLGDDDGSVRETAVDALRNQGNPEAIREIEKLLQGEQDENVCWAARRAIRELRTKAGR